MKYNRRVGLNMLTNRLHTLAPRLSKQTLPKEYHLSKLYKKIPLNSNQDIHNIIDCLYVSPQLLITTKQIIMILTHFILSKLFPNTKIYYFKPQFVKILTNICKGNKRDGWQSRCSTC